MGLQGNLADLPFQDLISSILRNKRNGHQDKLLVINPPVEGYRATIIFHKGTLYAGWITCKSQIGTVVKYVGDEAINYLLACETGEFMYGGLSPEYVLPERNIFQTYHLRVAEVQSAPPVPVATVGRRAGTTLLSDSRSENAAPARNQTNMLTGLINRFRNS